MNTFFVDTNFFLQCRDPVELVWRDVAIDDDVLILVPRTVQQEIDQLKQSGNSRRAKRARKASSLFRKIIASDDLMVTIRDSAPRVLISFPPPLGPKRERPVALDLSQSDDRLVEEALEYSDKYPEKKVRLLTHDTNPLLTARHCGLPYTMIPDTWLLGPETDDRDKEIGEIKRRLGVLEKDFPQIGIDARDYAGRALSQLEVNLITFSALSAGDADQLVSEMCLRHPMAEQFGIQGGQQRGHEQPFLSVPVLLGGRYEPPTDEEIQHYRDIEYPRWIERMRKFLESLPMNLELPRRHIVVTFFLNNDGVRPAENVVVEFKTHGGLLLMPRPHIGESEKNDNENHALNFPAPPRPPAGRRVSLVSSLIGTIHSGIAEMPRSPLELKLPALDRLERDPHAFYRKGGRTDGYADVLVYTCEEFRHKVDTKSFNLSVFVPSNAAITNALVTCQVTATNLPEPLVKKLPVRISYENGDTLAEARRLAPRLG